MNKPNIQFTPIRSDKDSKKRLRKIETPEGIELAVYLAPRGDRASAVIVDFVIISLMVVGIGLTAALIGKLTGAFSAGIFFLLSYFFLRSFYFIFFELKWKGQTPGKRYFGLRVIKRSGGKLDSGSIFARNLMREVEIFLPMTVIFAGGIILDGWMLLFSWLWCGIMVFMPFFNKDNMRVGDLVGGTWVISMPKTALLDEVGIHAENTSEEKPSNNVYFTKEQLSIYGIYELHTLENVLRSENPELHNNVMIKIQNKIGWKADQFYGTAEEFLQAFYSELRRHHEGEILMGRRQKDKYSGKHRYKEPKPIKNILKDR